MSCDHQKDQMVRTKSGRQVKLCDNPECWPSALEWFPKPPPEPKPKDQPPHPGWEMFKLVSSDTYRSQGFGAAKYAREAAHMTAEELRKNDFEAEVRTINEHTVNNRDWYGRPCGSTYHADFEVWSNAPTDFRPQTTVKEWVKNCWKNGVNPRVYNPYLPHGFEERNGLDYFGGEK